MVCKEEVFVWFQNLRAPTRIEAMYVILNMCYPLELRYYGSCLEEIAQRDYHKLKDEERKANDLAVISTIRNIHEPRQRSKLSVTLSLLQSTNVTAAQELFKVLEQEISVPYLASLGIFANSRATEEYLLVLALALHHPAFSFEQQCTLTDVYLEMEEYVNQMSKNVYQSPFIEQVGYIPPPHPAPVSEGYSHGFDAAHQILAKSQQTQPQQYPVHITCLKVKPPHKKTSIRIRVTWGSTKITDVFKSPNDLSVFHQQLVQSFPKEAKITSQEKYIPLLPHVISTWNRQNLSEIIISACTEYIQQLSIHLPGYVLESELVRNFMSSVRGTQRNSKNIEGCQEIPSKLQSMTIYNSRMPENSPLHISDKRQKPIAPGTKRFVENGTFPFNINSHLESFPLPSPYNSPLNSDTNSCAHTPWSHMEPNSHSDSSVEKTHSKDGSEYYAASRCRKTDESVPPVDELTSLSLSKDQMLMNSEIKCPAAILSYNVTKGSLAMKSAPVSSQSSESSPMCSEYSSPPQSPLPSEASNNGSLSSGNEEICDKRTLIRSPNETSKMDDLHPSFPDLPFKLVEGEPVMIKANLNHPPVTVLPFAAPYNSIVTQMPPPQNMKPAYLPVPCRSGGPPQHLSPGTIIFDSQQFPRVPLPSALTFIPGPPPRSTTTPDRIISATVLPLSSVSPFPVTSGCATLPSASCSITTQRSSNMTMVTNSGGWHNKNPINIEVVTKSSTDVPYATGYILNPSTSVSCACYTTNSARPSPSPSPSILSPGTTPSAGPVTMSYLGMPYLFHHSIPFLQPPANGFVPGQTGMSNGFAYPLPNGLPPFPPELIYSGHGFAMPPQSSQGNPSHMPTPVSQCYVPYPQAAAAVPVKLVSCYNCGKVGHHGPECKEPSFEEITHPGKFHLNYNPLPTMPDNHE